MNVIPYWCSALAALFAAVLGIAYGRFLYRSGFKLSDRIGVRDCPLIPMALLLFVLLQIGTSTLLNNPRIGWYLPVPIEYHLTAGTWLLKVVFVTFALSAITTVGFQQRHGARYLLALFAVAVVITVDSLNRFAAQPYLGEIQAKVENGVVLQTNPSTCAAASAANIARQFGMAPTEADMVKLLHTTWAGTAPSQLVYGFRALGLEAKKVYHQDRDLAKVQAPAVLLVDFGLEPDGHAVAYIGRVGALYEIWDPSPGRCLVAPENFKSLWRGRAIEVRRKDDA